MVITPELSTELHLAILKDSHHTSSLFHINLLQEYLALFPELKWPEDSLERINVPGTVSDDNWTYHYRPLLEEITAHPGLKNQMKTIIQ